ncbi:uncharacterized protein LOC133781936 [Humulus lupulus]|uniref:uncharacterized protein LOC133781936 n=1 Tax=Humulus lupulus TaxID=3486 RepID=UPI002B414D19|nr:uncharacterized protein LOC133781936 [Humulus lupulus]
MGNSHTHQLVLKTESQTDINCGVCDDEISEPSFYECELCDACCVHTACQQILSCDQINHPFHPSHLLILSADEGSFICSSCHQIHFFKPCFACQQCNFYMDIKCVQMPPITFDDDGEHIQHFTHQHPMPLCYIKDEFKGVLKCFACRMPCPGEVYGCNTCGYVLHKSCAHLPETIQPHSCHHPDHPLSIYIASKQFTRCKLCYKGELFFIFGCCDCDFYLCVNCATTVVPPPIKYRYHQHPLYFVETIYTNLEKCDGYDSYCKNPILQGSVEFEYTNSSVFCCTKCDFKVHLLCGMLPNSIKYDNHIHTLSLTDLVIENGFGEYCCDVCENDRNPRLCVYYCEDCVYIAHVHCLASEIINILKGEVKDVNLKMVGEDLSKFIPIEYDNAELEDTENGMPLLTLKDLVSKLDKSELRSELKHQFDSDGFLDILSSWLTGNPEDENIDDILRFSNFTEKEFMSVIYNEFHKNYLDKKMKIESHDLTLTLVDAKSYLIPLNFVFVMKHLLHKYGDIGQKSTSTPTLKSICFFFICKVMKQMHTTLLVDITKDLLLNWYRYISISKDCAHFQVDFLNVALKTITRYFFYLQVSKLLGAEIPTIINEKKEKLQEEMTEKMEKVQKKIAENTARLEKCKHFCESNSKKEFMEKGLNKVMTSKWKTAGHVGF